MAWTVFLVSCNWRCFFFPCPPIIMTASVAVRSVRVLCLLLPPNFASSSATCARCSSRSLFPYSKTSLLAARFFYLCHRWACRLADDRCCEEVQDRLPAPLVRERLRELGAVSSVDQTRLLFGLLYLFIYYLLSIQQWPI